jgi:exodeoxyribonuclease VIII
MIKKMSDAEYFKTEGISQSFLKAFKRSPAHALWQLNHPKEPTDAMLIGTCLHALILERKRVFAALPESAKGASNAAKAVKAAFAIEHEGKIILSADDAAKVEAMAESVLNHSGARAILDLGGESELSIFWNENELEMKGKIDRVNPLGIIDVKTTKDASLAEFAKSVYNFGYHIQAAHYLAGAAANGLPCDDFIIIAVENEPPYCTALRKIDHVSIMEGEQERQELIAKYKKCVEKNEWKGYNDEIETVSIPRWGFKHIINEEY